ncbi:protein of unknown function [Candidatus Nitrosotalea okcheonensis]|uniref:Uncharacterized protein n=1 Tax=Candidatus Nitrosotalea okcheonensis TaxID=1903276 RepID=A0A2H1FFQ1_9ARCH|nr:protein of unknown function [Candidatus Nitrosotalea okcheonensis]
MVLSPGWQTWLPQTWVGFKIDVVRPYSPAPLVRALASCIAVMDSTRENSTAKTSTFLDIFSI